VSQWGEGGVEGEVGKICLFTGQKAKKDMQVEGF